MEVVRVAGPASPYYVQIRAISARTGALSLLAL